MKPMFEESCNDFHRSSPSVQWKQAGWSKDVNLFLFSKGSGDLSGNKSWGPPSSIHQRWCVWLQNIQVDTALFLEKSLIKRMCFCSVSSFYFERIHQKYFWLKWVKTFWYPLLAGCSIAQTPTCWCCRWAKLSDVTPVMSQVMQVHTGVWRYIQMYNIHFLYFHFRSIFYSKNIKTNKCIYNVNT